ncbi:MAG: hypothetical protein WDZ80_07605 [Candidatus Paceibacterota bacterium]
MEKHFVCTGKCGGVSDTPGVCKAEDCDCSGQDLKECNCNDGNHKEVLEKEEKEDE